ncbi:high affinity immunoglobulin epsilon receptor subunit beta-like isoform X1 [Suricata suricatta]|uniref:high affinity immunoglobulin epsilon receptor subunit beta-like isoform X1 n=1 Tax=Suricata suricatta TaxID=37032 RepID=UPI0011569590|nr:high affinity immunoglobulin epsilon receptor subunit beta-like isoform X1 [Suricata suricatta]
MDTEGSRAGLALPNPQNPSSVPEIELSEVSLRDHALRERAGPAPPHHRLLMFLRRELQFLGVTQILIALICLCFGIMVLFAINIFKFEEDVFSSFEAGYPFWGSAFFAISGLLPIMYEKKHTVYLVWGSLGANTISSITAGIGIFILIINLESCRPYIYSCRETNEDDSCFVAYFSTEVVAMILFLTILGFCSAVSLMIYGVGEVFQGKKIPEDRLYEELNIYSPIYSELEDKGETTSPADS